MHHLDPETFVRTVKPLLERKDLSGLHTLLLSQFSPNDITSLLSCGCCDTRKIAALSLGLVGSQRCLKDLAKQLADPDPMINQMAEHAMWSIWFRGGTKEANCKLHTGAQAIERGEYEVALDYLDKALQISPEFAEAHNQRALALYLMDRYAEALTDCHAAIERMPLHFGAWASKGHCHAHLEQFDRAIGCYEKALSINPHMEQVQQVVQELKARFGGNAECRMPNVE